MKCISNGKIVRIISFLLSIFVVCISLEGCGKTPALSFQDNASYSNFNFMIGESGSAEVASAFAQNLCVAGKDQNSDALSSMNAGAAVALFDVNNRKTLYAKNVFTRLYPASLTKIMTALVALKNAKLDTILTASENVTVTEANAQVAGLKKGDTMTLDQALHILLIYSANDVAILIAENIGGSVSNFIQMMNAEAKSLGATNTNFINSNGLSDQNHYTTAYDMYLIFNAAMQYSTFQEIINMPVYKTAYHDASGASKDISVSSTNYYMQNMSAAEAPTGITVIGGKTGTTTAAGHCLILLAKDTSGNPYIAVVMRARDNDELYRDMNELLSLIPQS